MHHLRAEFSIALACLVFAVTARGEDIDARNAAQTPLSVERFDCENAFDLIAMMVIARCSVYQAPATASAALAAAATRLRAAGLASEEEFAASHIAFCPLATGSGMVPAPGQLYLDDGLIGLSTDGLAEILAHELAHVRQFEQLGRRGFKCEYVRDMLACGGCQNRDHRLEAEAYARQDQVRERLIEITSEHGAAD